ncbi:hypothetical protein [Nocardia rosealba]|uniref:hypothetical protein n=1 Tax=Nocardia rosealba TaxID=2878563 RepID=UPI001CD9BD03|nr:hypothetical protein [Nocardia rosealba]MCA2207899.1 hypothetical protein [Nocardia rosealba]
MFTGDRGRVSPAEQGTGDCLPTMVIGDEPIDLEIDPVDRRIDRLHRLHDLGDIAEVLLVPRIRGVVVQVNAEPCLHEPVDGFDGNTGGRPSCGSGAERRAYIVFARAAHQFQTFSDNGMYFVMQDIAGRIVRANRVQNSVDDPLRRPRDLRGRRGR